MLNDPSPPRREGEEADDLAHAAPPAFADRRDGASPGGLEEPSAPFSASASTARSMCSARAPVPFKILQDTKLPWNLAGGGRYRSERCIPGGRVGDRVRTLSRRRPQQIFDATVTFQLVHDAADFAPSFCSSHGRPACRRPGADAQGGSGSPCCDMPSSRILTRIASRSSRWTRVGASARPRQRVHDRVVGVRLRARG